MAGSLIAAGLFSLPLVARWFIGRPFTVADHQCAEVDAALSRRPRPKVVNQKIA